MKKLFSSLGQYESEGNGVFADEDCLRPGFQPPEILHREHLLQEMASALAPALQGRPASNLFVHGPPGTGKTTCAKHVLKELQDFSEKAKGIYVNAWQSDSKHAVFSDIAFALGEILPRRGTGSDEIFSRIIQAARRENKSLAIILDEADRIFQNKEESLLYELTRANEQFGTRISVILISNDSSLLAKADLRIRSSLSPKVIEFQKYTPPQLKEILRQRAKTAFKPNACSEEAIALCAAHAARLGGDARIALETLWQAGNNAAVRGGSRVELEDAKSAVNEHAPSWKKEEKLETTTEDENALMQILKEKGSLTTGEALQEFCKKKEITLRGFRNVVNSLEQKKLLQTQEIPGKSGKGKTRQITLL